MQEQAYRRQRERDRNRLSVKETEELYTQEIEALKERIKELEARSLMVASSFIGNETNSSQWNQDLFVMDIMEIYEGETSDRLQYLIKAALQAAEMYGLDGRTKAVARQLLEKNVRSKEVDELKRQLDRVIRDPKKFPKEISVLLTRYGYTQKSEKNHVRLEPNPDLEGLECLTIVKTPSDYRSLKNQKSQIENALGISKLN